MYLVCFSSYLLSMASSANIVHQPLMLSVPILDILREGRVPRLFNKGPNCYFSD